jgi:hypothetical protein
MAKIKAKEMEVITGKEETPVSTNKTLLSDIEQLKNEGKTNTDEFRSKVRQLEVLLGIESINPFGTNELDIFEENMREMTLADIKKLAERVGVNPYLDKPTLKTILRKEFIAVNRNNRRNIMPSPVNSVVLDRNNPKHANVMKILGEF